MPRQARAVIVRCAHHVTQRGNNRQDVFFVDADRQAYLAYLQDAARRFPLRVEGYCLMTNIAKLETFLGRRLRPLPHGRPRRRSRKPTIAEKVHDT